jgi:hypothetical protein
MNGRSQMQESKNWILLKEINVNRLDWTEWRERGYGLYIGIRERKGASTSMFKNIRSNPALKKLYESIS